MDDCRFLGFLVGLPFAILVLDLWIVGAVGWIIGRVIMYSTSFLLRYITEGVLLWVDVSMNTHLNSEDPVTINHLSVKGNNICDYSLPDILNLETMLVEETAGVKPKKPFAGLDWTGNYAKDDEKREETSLFGLGLQSSDCPAELGPVRLRQISGQEFCPHNLCVRTTTLTKWSQETQNEIRVHRAIIG